MAKSREQKQKIIEDLKEKIQKQKSIVFVDFSGLQAPILWQLREELKELEGSFQVVKKTLLKNILKNLKKEDFLEEIEKIKGQLALAFGFEDEIAPFRICYKIAKDNENLKILGGILGNEFLTPEKVMEIAQLPTREEFLARLVGSLQSPISGLANILKGNLRKLIYILSQIKVTQ
ncbi:50S ribosomal protein L10 [bacterium]|nr:50S ribosomal protein L10 [bacterium]